MNQTHRLTQAAIQMRYAIQQRQCAQESARLLERYNTIEHAIDATERAIRQASDIPNSIHPELEAARAHYCQRQLFTKTTLTCDKARTIAEQAALQTRIKALKTSIKRFETHQQRQLQQQQASLKRIEQGQQDEWAIQRLSSRYL